MIRPAFAVVILSGLLCSCGKKQDGMEQAPSGDYALVEFTLTDSGLLRVSMRRLSALGSLEGPVPITIESEDGIFKMVGSIEQRERLAKALLEIDTKTPVKLDLAGIPDATLKRDGEPADVATVFPAGKHKFEVEVKLPEPPPAATP